MAREMQDGKYVIGRYWTEFDMSHTNETHTVQHIHV